MKRAQAFLIALLTFLLCCVLIGMRPEGNRMYGDEVLYHLPTIQHFAAGGSLADYPAASAPGYHLLLAGVLKYVTGWTPALRLVSAALTAALVFGLASIWTAGSSAAGAWLALPATVSLYIIPAGVWLLPDNLGWLTILGVLALCLLPSWRTWHIVALVILCASAVIVRQSNLWLIAPAVASCLAGPGRGWSFTKRLIAAAAMALPAMLTLVVLVAVWGGLTPPSFQGTHQALQPAAVPFTLFLVGAYGIFYIAALRAPVLSALSVEAARRTALWGAALGAMVSLFPATSYDFDAGRFGGLWNLIRLIPAPLQRSPGVVAGAAAGGALLALWMRALPPAARWTLGAAVAGFCLSQVANHYAFERYYAGFALLLPALVAMAGPRGTATVDRWSLAGSMSLFVFNAGVLAFSWK